jgi:hypothetical protein
LRPDGSNPCRHVEKFRERRRERFLRGHLTELARGRELALALGQAAAAVQAEHYRGKAVGLYEDRLNISASTSDADLIKAIEDLFGEEISKAIGTALGVSDEEDETT